MQKGGNLEESLEECKAFVDERGNDWPLLGCNSELVCILVSMVHIPRLVAGNCNIHHVLLTDSLAHLIFLVRVYGLSYWFSFLFDGYQVQQLPWLKEQEGLNPETA